MLKRFKWTLIFSVAVIGIVIYPNLIILTDSSITGREQSQVNFIALTIIEALLIFNTVFHIVTEWYRLHPPHTKSIEAYRETNPDIPDKYFANIGGEGGKGGAPDGEGGEGGEGKGEGGHGGKGGKGGHG